MGRIVRFLGLLLFVNIAQATWAQQAIEVIEPRKIVECPTAGLLPRGSFDLDLRIFPEGGILSGIEVGLMDRLLLGFSFGGEHIIGDETVDWYPKAELAAKYRLFEEGQMYPAVAIGFDSQGFGGYIDSLKRYEIKSKGVYIALSKNYAFLGGMGIHAGINYSLEKEDGDDDPSGYVGLDKSLNTEISLLVEYDFAINDNADNSLGSGDGYLNAGVRWTFAHKLDLEFDVKNLIENGKQNPRPSRELRLVYLEYF